MKRHYQRFGACDFDLIIGIAFLPFALIFGERTGIFVALMFYIVAGLLAFAAVCISG